MKRASGIAVAALLAISCRATFVRSSGRLPPPATRAVGVGLATPLPSFGPPGRGVRPAAASSLLVVRLNDQNGGHPGGIPVSVAGTLTEILTTDATGAVRITKPGTYTLRVAAGCTGTLQVLAGGSARVALPEGGRIEGGIAVRWRHRIAPAPPVFDDPVGRWTVGSDASVIFSVIDRCTESFATNAAFPTFDPVSSQNVVVQRVDRQSDASHQARVVVRCRAPGPVSILLRDRTNPPDSLDLVRASIDEPPSCTG